jgi:hypothetical protein
LLGWSSTSSILNLRIMKVTPHGSLCFSHVILSLALSEVAPFLQLRKASFSVHEFEDHILPPSPDKEELTVCG